MASVKARLTNKAQGPRGVWASGDLIDIAPKGSRVLTFVDTDELGQVDKASFTIEVGDDVDFDVSVPKRVFIALTDSDDHTNFRFVDFGAAKLVGIAMAEEAPILPGGYRWIPVSEPGDFMPAPDLDIDAGALDAPVRPPLSGKNKAQLLAIAAAEGVTEFTTDDGTVKPITDGTNNDIVAAIEAKREPAA